MAKRVTANQLVRAFKTAPDEVEREGKKFIQRGISEYKRIAVQGSPWRVGQSGGGIPRDTGNLRERHKTHVRGLRGTFGVSDQDVPYAKYVHGNKPYQVKVKSRSIQTRPWLNYARNQADDKIERHYRIFMDTILGHLAT